MPEAEKLSGEESPRITKFLEFQTQWVELELEGRNGSTFGEISWTG